MLHCPQDSAGTTAALRFRSVTARAYWLLKTSPCRDRSVSRRQIPHRPCVLDRKQDPLSCLADLAALVLPLEAVTHCACVAVHRETEAGGRTCLGLYGGRAETGAGEVSRLCSLQPASSDLESYGKWTGGFRSLLKVSMYFEISRTFS